MSCQCPFHVTQYVTHVCSCAGIYVQEMSDPDTAKLYSGLLRIGDEVLEVNGTKVSILGKTRLTELMNWEPVLSLRVLHQRRTKC